MKSRYFSFFLLVSMTGVAFRPATPPSATFHYYVSATCFCAPTKQDDKALHLFITAIANAEGDQYRDEKIRSRFNDQLKLDYDQWFEIGLGSMSVKTFASAEEASDAQRSQMARMKIDGYKLHTVSY